jgi:hypothetical protein
MSARMKGATMSRSILPGRTGLAALGLWLALTAGARAVDGVLEISQACVQAGCFPGDAPGFPVTLRTGASYRLTSDLVTSDGNVTAIEGIVPGTTGLAQNNGTIALDLNGFSIRCFVSPLLGAGTGASCSGSGIGIDLRDIANATVRDGMVRNMGAHGIALGDRGRVLRVHAIGNGPAETSYSGIACGTGCSISESIADSNGRGVATGDNAAIVDVSSLHNYSVGILVGAGSVVTRCAIRENGSHGLLVGRASTITLSSIALNQGSGITSPIGLDPGAGWPIPERFAYGSNSLDRNNPTADGYDPQVGPGGVEIATNLCGGIATCP